MVADGRKVIAELWLRKRVERSGTGWSSRGPPGSGPRPLGRLGGGPLIHRTVFRGWVRPGGTNAAADVAGGRIAAGRRRRTDKHKNTELRRGLHAWDGLGRPKGVGHESSPAVGRKTAAVACGRKARSLRRHCGAACSEGPGPREGPGAKAPCAQQTTRTAQSLKLAQSAAALLTHNRYCSSDHQGGATIYLRLC